MSFINEYIIGFICCTNCGGSFLFIKDSTEPTHCANCLLDLTEDIWKAIQIIGRLEGDGIQYKNKRYIFIIAHHARFGLRLTKGGVVISSVPSPLPDYITG